jgi:iduronate 2-sulfatase
MAKLHVTRIAPFQVFWLFAFIGAPKTVVAAAEAVRPPERPNVLFIAVDDLRPELGCYGQAHVKSPHIDRLAQSGVTFTRAYCQQAVCNPSRASLMTGLRPDTVKVWDLRTDFRDTRPNAVTLPQYFKQNGYHSVAIGKIYHNIIPDPLSWSEPKLHIDGYPFDPDAVYRAPQNVDWLARRQKEITEQGNQDRYIDRLGQWYLKSVATENVDVPDNAYFDGAQTDKAIEKLGQLRDRQQPFFFAIGYYRPHLPFNAPKKYWDLYDRNAIPLADNDRLPQDAPLMAVNTIRELRGYTDFKQSPTPDRGGLTEAQSRLLRHGYFASVSYIDAQIGRLLDELDRLALRDKTIVILWGDHGWKLGEHRSWCKMTNYEIDTRVPLIVSAPSAKERANKCDRLVEFVDIYPTLCDLAGLRVPGQLEGASFAPLLNDCTHPWKTAAFSQFLREGKWVAPDGIEYMGHSIRTDRYRYVVWTNWETKEFAARELYDHQADPQENVNIAELPGTQEVVKGLDARLRAGWRAALPK